MTHARAVAVGCSVGVWVTGHTSNLEPTDAPKRAAGASGNGSAGSGGPNFPAAAGLEKLAENGVEVGAKVGANVHSHGAASGDV